MNRHFLSICLTAALPLVFSCGKNPQPAPDPDAAYSSLAKVSFTETDESFPNPERGFLVHREYKSSEPEIMPESVPESNYLAGRTLVYTIYYLNTFMESDISDAYLKVIGTNLETLRAHGNKCVLRFAYNRSYSELNHPWDASEQWVMRHIEQLSPILKDYADVIFVLEAGFIGTFGEWYYTDNFDFNPRKPENYLSRRRVVDALLKALPAQRQIAVRYPAAKLGMFDITVADSLDAQTAYSGTPISRIAAHNDCFVSSSNDVGTYSHSSERLYIHNESRYLIMGGETCAQTAFSDRDNALKQCAYHHLTYLNLNYHQAVINKWKKDDTYDIIDKRMGYRLVLDRAFVTKEPAVGEDMRVVLKIRNVGYASPKNPRDAELVFVSDNDGKTFTVPLNADPRTWYENIESEVDAAFALPDGMTTGKYTLYLNLPDPMQTLRNNPRYSIRMANKGIWEESRGYNKICDITVK